MQCRMTAAVFRERAEETSSNLISTIGVVDLRRGLMDEKRAPGAAYAYAVSPVSLIAISSSRRRPRASRGSSRGSAQVDSFQQASLFLAVLLSRRSLRKVGLSISSSAVASYPGGRPPS